MASLFRSCMLVIAAALLCVACTLVYTKTPDGDPVLMNEEQFAAYVEHVFRYHNSVVNESLFVIPGDLGSGKDPVSNAEMKMHHACQPLNEVASSSAVGLSPDFWTKIKLAEAVPECEAATRKLEKLLSQANK